MKKIGPAMCVEYVDANNRRFVISFVASRIDHQIYLAISRYEALIEGFLTHVFVPNSASDRERSNKYKFAASSAPLLRFFLCSLSLSLFNICVVCCAYEDRSKHTLPHTRFCTSITSTYALVSYKSMFLFTIINVVLICCKLYS